MLRRLRVTCNHNSLRPSMTNGTGISNVVDSKTTSMRIRDRTGRPPISPGLNGAPRKAFRTASSTAGRVASKSGSTSRTIPSSSICNAKTADRLPGKANSPGHGTVILRNGTGGEESAERGRYSDCLVLPSVPDSLGTKFPRSASDLETTGISSALEFTWNCSCADSTGSTAFPAGGRSSGRNTTCRRPPAST